VEIFDADNNLVTSDEISREDEAIIGNAIPDFEIGWTNSVRHRNWDFNVFFRGVFGHDLVNSARVFFENPANITTYNVTTSAFDLVDLTSAPAYSSYHVEDATFVRLQNMSIGYTVPLPAGSAINNLHLSISGNNLLTITGYDGIDPEVRWLDGNNPLAPGIERREQWYTARSFTFGVNIDF
jgi:TonB-dependent starch-binding outer membrane protein SusC